MARDGQISHENESSFSDEQPLLCNGEPTRANANQSDTRVLFLLRDPQNLTRTVEAEGSDASVDPTPESGCSVLLLIQVPVRRSPSVEQRGHAL